MAKIDAFFEKVGDIDALTFDDVRVRTDYSSEDFHSADLNTRFSRNVKLKIPIVSAAMDTVTEQRMAIALASLGGIGIIHRNLDPETQAKQVKRVKLHMNGMVDKPRCVKATDTVEEVLKMCEDKHFIFRSFPVIDDDKRLVGILTGNDIDFCDQRSTTVAGAMTAQVLSMPENTTIDQAYPFMRDHKIKVLPLVNANNEVVGLYLWSDLLRVLNQDGMHNLDSNGQLVVGAAIGTGSEDLDRAKELIAKGVDVIVIDTSHADSYLVMSMFERVKQHRSNVDVVVGNISEYDSAKRLVEARVDGIKVGQGGGSICSTRVVAGIGAPQVSSIYHCKKAVRDKNADIPVCGDGGLRDSGDVPIALAAGADSVMMGKMLAGTDESPGDIIDHPSGPVKRYRGMGSLGAMQDNAGSRERYGERYTAKSMILPEGVGGYVPYVGGLASTIHRLNEAIRRSMGYTGNRSIPELQEKANFWRITNAGIRESHPHDIIDPGQ